MKWFACAVALACGLLALDASAQKFGTNEVPPKPDQQRPVVIQNIYVSPGAYGGYGGYSREQRYDGYGGYRAPRGYYDQRSSTVIQSGSGGVRQSIQYPNGTVYPRQ